MTGSLLADSERERARRVNPLKLMPASYPVRRVAEYKYRLKCPSHDDAKPSLSLFRDDSSGVWIWRCFGCELKGDSITWGMELCGLSFQDAVAQLLDNGPSPKPTSVIVAKYDYVDEAGALLYQVVRYEPKAFRQRAKTPAGWRWTLGDTRRVLYHLPRVMAAKRLYYTEGEKDVHTLERLGFCATTNSGGAGNFRDRLLDSVPLAAQIHIVPHNDDAGSEMMRRVFAAAMNRGMPQPEIHYVPKPAKDVTEHMERGGSAAFLEPTQRG